MCYLRNENIRSTIAASAAIQSGLIDGPCGVVYGGGSSPGSVRASGWMSPAPGSPKPGETFADVYTGVAGTLTVDFVPVDRLSERMARSIRAPPAFSARS